MLGKITENKTNKFNDGKHCHYRERSIYGCYYFRGKHTIGEQIVTNSCVEL